MTLRFRILVTLIFLGLFIIIAGYSAIPEGNPVRTPAPAEDATTIDWLTEFFNELDDIDIAHVLLHLAVFTTVGVLLGLWGTSPERGSVRLVYTVTIIATIIWEAVQAGVFVSLGGLGGDPFFNAPWVSRVVSDLVVNMIGASLGLLITTQFAQPIEQLAQLIWRLNPLGD